MGCSVCCWEGGLELARTFAGDGGLHPTDVALAAFNDGVLELYVSMEGQEAAQRIVLRLDSDTLALLVGSGGRDVASGLTLAFPSQQVAELQALREEALPLLATLLTVAEADALTPDLAPVALADTSFASFLPEADRPLAKNRLDPDDADEAETGTGAVADGQEAPAVTRLVLGIDEGYQRVYREAKSRGFGEAQPRAVPALSAEAIAGVFAQWAAGVRGEVPGREVEDPSRVPPAPTDKGRAEPSAEAPDEETGVAPGVPEQEARAPEAEEAGPDRHISWSLAAPAALVGLAWWLNSVPVRRKRNGFHVSPAASLLRIGASSSERPTPGSMGAAVGTVRHSNPGP